MANLKGGSFDKQVKDIHHRLSAFGESRHNRDDHKTHSSALSEKRGEYSRSFASYAESSGFEGKLNEAMTNENIKDFLEQRTENLSPKSAENYARGFGAMIEGLKESNVTIFSDKEVINTFVSNLDTQTEIRRDRAVSNPETVINNLYEKRFDSGVVAEVQRDLGLRVAEARELISNHNKYIKEDTVSGIVGKGSHIYPDKSISAELVSKIESVEELSSLRTYQNDLENQDITSHDWRYTYVVENIDSMSHSELSEQLNHSRESMTDYYLGRA